MNESTLIERLAERYGIELAPSDLIRTQSLVATALRDLECYRAALNFHSEAAAFENVLRDCRETRT